MDSIAVRLKLCAVAAIIAGGGLLWMQRFHDSPEQQVELSTTKVGEGLKARHVVVTGGAGYIGSHAAERLLELGHFVTVVDNLSRGNMGAIRALNATYPNRLRFVHGDLGSRHVVRHALLGGPRKAELVIHFAAVAYVGESMANPLLYYNNITVNSLILVEEMLRFKVHRLVYSSTCATYGSPPQSELPATEKTRTEPVSPYGTAKLIVENTLWDVCKAHPSFKVGILRYFNVFGCDPKGKLGEWPRRDLQTKHGRITNACLDAAQGLIPEVHLHGTAHPTPDGTVIRDFIHVTDLVDAHVALVPKLSNPPALYNVGTGTGVSMRELLTACQKVTGINFTITSHLQGRPGDSPMIYADSTKIKTDLNWAPRFPSIESGLSHCWRWRQSHKNGYS